MKDEECFDTRIYIDELVKVKGFFYNRFNTLGVIVGNIIENGILLYEVKPVEEMNGINIYCIQREDLIRLGELNENTGNIRRLFYPKDYIKPKSNHSFYFSLDKLFKKLKC